MHIKSLELKIIVLTFIVTLLTGLLYADNASQPQEETMSSAQELLKQADDMFLARQYAESRPVYEKALKAAEEAGNKSDQAEALAMIARTYLVLEEKETGRKWLEKAKIAADYDEPKGWSRFLGVNGRFLWKDDLIEDATMMFQNMFDYCNDNGLVDRAIDAAHMIALLGDADNQIKWGIKGIKAAEEAGETRWLGPLWNNLGATYEEMGREYEALEAYIKARKYHYMHGATINKAIADWAIGHMYVKIGDYINGAEWLDPILPTFEKLGDEEFIGLTCKEIGEIKFANKEYQEALDLFTRAEALLKKAGMDEWDAKGYQHIVARIEQLKETLK